MEFADRSMATCIMRFSLTAGEREPMAVTLPEVDRGMLPIDSVELLEEQRIHIDVDRSVTLDGIPYKKLAENGMRNSNVGHAPTAQSQQS